MLDGNRTIFDVAMRLAYHIFLRLNSAHYHGNVNEAGAAVCGGGFRDGIRLRQSGAVVRVGVGATLEAFSRAWVELRL